jgi:hypothetical protein
MKTITNLPQLRQIAVVCGNWWQLVAIGNNHKIAPLLNHCPVTLEDVTLIAANYNKLQHFVTICDELAISFSHETRGSNPLPPFQVVE